MKNTIHRAEGKSNKSPAPQQHKSSTSPARPRARKAKQSRPRPLTMKTKITAEEQRDNRLRTVYCYHGASLLGLNFLPPRRPICAFYLDQVPATKRLGIIFNGDLTGRERAGDYVQIIDPAAPVTRGDEVVIRHAGGIEFAQLGRKTRLSYHIKPSWTANKWKCIPLADVHDIAAVVETRRFTETPAPGIPGFDPVKHFEGCRWGDETRKDGTVVKGKPIRVLPVIHIVPTVPAKTMPAPTFGLPI
jgi:hypothetical protein